MHGHAMDSRDAERLHEVLAVLAPPRRFGLLLLLLSGVDRSVCQLASAVGLSQSCTTRHLQALERAGLVRGTRDGKRVVFRTAPRGAAAAGVLASLAGQSAPAKVFVALTPAPRAPGSKRRADPVATARRRASSRSPAPVSATEVVESRPSGPITAAGTPTPHAPPESGNNSAPASPPPRHWQELEDYLL
jgi:DNA-binding transcriptional ArsR family regulator